MGNVSTVSIGIIAYNEKLYLPDLLADLNRQTYDKKKIEVIMVDGNSSDDTLNIMKRFQSSYINDFADIKIFHNYKRIQPAGWNIVIQNTTSDVLLRIDAHARLTDSFVENNVKCINSGESVCGGPRENIIDGDSAWKHMLLDAEQSLFGAGIASYRNETKKKKYVKSAFHACYRHDVINNVGFFNEELIRTEDNEYHYRIRQAGYKICYDPQIKSFYQTRSSLKRMLRQKYLNGFWIGKTLYKCPGCISVFHLVPLAFVCAIVLTALTFIMFDIMWPTVTLWCSYGAFSICMTIVSFLNSKEKSGYCLLLPLIFLILHISYGVGSLSGIAHR